MKEELIYSYRRLLLFTCYLTVLEWGLILAIIISMIIDRSQHHKLYLYIIIVGFTILGLPLVFLLSTLKCDNCKNHLFDEKNGENIHPNANKIRGISYWATIVVNVVWKRKFICMHCGQNYKV
jgi:hypothetical protein